MKAVNYLILPILLFFLTSCEKEDLLQEASILEINLSQNSTTQEPQEISIKIKKPTPCHHVSETNKTVSGNVYYYDFVLSSGAEVCADVIAEETVQVTFDPSSSGEYTLNFLINGKLYETRKVTVTE